MKTFNWKNISVIIAVLIFCLSYYLASVEEKYKCFAELYPEKAEQSKTPALGEIKIIDGKKIRAIAEAKNPNGDQWTQWVDWEPFDNVCDYAVMFTLEENGYLYFKVYTCDHIDEIIKQQCKEEGVDFNKIKHFAEPIILKYKPGKQDI